MTRKCLLNQFIIHSGVQVPIWFLLKTPQFWFFVNFKIKESSVPVFGQKKKHNEKINNNESSAFFLGRQNFVKFQHEDYDFDI
jgi:hypothetical protein